MAKVADLKIGIDDRRRFQIQACCVPLPVFDKKLSQMAMLTYFGLAYYAGSSSSCHASVRELANLLGISRAAVKRGLKELEQKKLIEKKANFHKATKHQPKGQREQLANDYILLHIDEKSVPI